MISRIIGMFILTVTVELIIFLMVFMVTMELSVVLISAGEVKAHFKVDGILIVSINSVELLI
jgi:hypothetical protein